MLVTNSDKEWATGRTRNRVDEYDEVSDEELDENREDSEEEQDEAEQDEAQQHRDDNGSALTVSPLLR